MCQSFLSNVEVLRVFAFEVLEILLDFMHLSLNITIGDDGLGALDESLLIVDTVEQDRESGLLGDEVEAFLPVRICRTGTFRSNAQLEDRQLAGGLCQVIGHAGAFGTPDGNASHTSEDGT